MGGAKSEKETGKATFIYPLSELCNCNEQDAERHGHCALTVPTMAALLLHCAVMWMDEAESGAAAAPLCTTRCQHARSLCVRDTPAARHAHCCPRASIDPANHLMQCFTNAPHPPYSYLIQSWVCVQLEKLMLNRDWMQPNRIGWIFGNGLHLHVITYSFI